MHNVKFKPDVGDPEFEQKQDSVASDIDVIGINPSATGAERVVVVSCKSWQAGLNIASTLTRIDQGKVSGGREEWRKYRELCQPKWSRAFMAAVERETGSRYFTYWTAVTSLSGKADRAMWEERPSFRQAIEGNPIRLVTFAEMLDDVWGKLSSTPAATELGRMIQLMKASRWLETRTS